MLSALRSQFSSLSLLSQHAKPLKNTFISTQRFFSASTTERNVVENDDVTSAFLDATANEEDFRIVKTVKKGIRGSPRKLGYLAQQIRGLSAQEALLQMKFSPKRKSLIVKKTIQNAVNLADIKYAIEPENLMVSECFVNKGTYLKRIRIMGRGRSGVMHRPFSHLTVVLREFDSSKKRLNKFLTKKLAREAIQSQKSKEATSITTEETTNKAQ